MKFMSDGRVVGYNTDQSGVEAVVSRLAPGKSSILGSGSMAKCFARELEKRGLEFEMYSRKLGNWDKRIRTTSNLINCTPIGMDGVSVPVSDLSGIRTIVDLPISSSEFKKRAEAAEVLYISGLELYGYVFLEQLTIYTGKKITRKELEGIKEEWIAHV
jgi:shikimate 5-dehydrogenase